MFELAQLEQLLAFAKHKTLSKAAEEMHLSQPALTRSMQRLEEDIGVPLFFFLNNKLSLNENGKLAVEFAEKIIFDVHTMPERLREFDRTRRTIYIGSCAPAPMWKLSHELSELYPELAISTDLKGTEEITRGFDIGKYDIIIMPEPTDKTEFVCFNYMTEHLMLSLPPAHPLAMYKEVSFDDINGETMLLYSDIGFWHDICAAKMPDTEFIIQSERDTFRSLVKLSALPSFTSDIVTDQVEEHRIIVPISDKEANPTFYIWIHKSKKSKFSRLCEALKDRISP